MLIARVEEKFAIRGLCNEFPGRVDIVFSNEDRIGIHAMDLNRQFLWPGLPKLGDRHTGIKEKSPACPRAGLSQLLGWYYAQRESGIDQSRGEILHRSLAALDHLTKPQFIDELHTLLEVI